MKVTVDGLITSANRIQNQRQPGSKGASESAAPQADNVSLNRKVSQRLDTIQQDFRTLQSSLTKNQIVMNGIERIQQGENPEQVSGEATYEGSQVLTELLKGDSNPQRVSDLGDEIQKLIQQDLGRLRELQVELDNISASNLVEPGKEAEMVQNINEFLASDGNASAVSSLSPDSVMRLVR